MGEFGGIGELAEAVDEGVEVAWGDQETGFAVDADFGSAVAIEGDDGFAGGEGLGQDAGEAFALGEVDEDIREGEVTGDVVWGDQSGEDEAALEGGLGGEGFEALPPGAISDEEETDVGDAPDEFGCGVEEVVMALEFEEAGDLGDDEVVGQEAELGSESGVWGGVEEGGEGEPGEDAGELGFVADAGGEVLAGHGIGDDDEVVGDPAGDLFGAGEGGIGDRALERAEGGAVDGVDDDGDAGGACGETAEDAGLAGVGVDDVGVMGAEMASEMEEGEEVGPGLDGADEFGDGDESVRERGELGFEGTFRAIGRAGEELDIPVGMVEEAEDGGDGILLGAADDEAGDDVGDSPGGRQGTAAHGMALMAVSRAVRLEWAEELGGTEAMAFSM